MSSIRVPRLALLLALSIVALTVLSPSETAEASHPPFDDTRQCTWYVDYRTQQIGWHLEFSKRPRDAWRWMDIVMNAPKGGDPRPQAIMVLDRVNLPDGHVAFVESVASTDRWTVSHKNWGPLGTPVKTDTFERVPGSPGRVRVVNNPTQYVLKGFIYNPAQGSNPQYRAQWIDKNTPPVLRRGECYGFFTRFRNVGTATWTRSIVRLGTDQDRDRIPGFIRDDLCNYQRSGWLSGNRVELRESSVAPNGIGSFLFYYTVPSTMAFGVYPEHFRLVADGVTWMTEVDPWVYWNVNVIDCPSCQYRDHYHVWATGSGAISKAVYWAANSFVAKSPSIRRVTFNAALSAQAVVAIFNCPAMTWDSCLVAYQTVPVAQYGASVADWGGPIPVTVGKRYWVQIGATPQVPGNPLLAFFSATNSYQAADAPGQPAKDASCAVYHHISSSTKTTECGIDLNVRVEAP